MTPSVASVAAATPSLSTLTAAVGKAGLADWLSNGTNTLTVFAPSDDAFAAYLTKAGITAEDLLASPDLKSILKYHIVPGAAAKSTDLKDGQTVSTKLGGAPLTLDLSSTPGSVIVKGSESSAKVISADVPAGNSVVHVIDAVLVPSSSQIAEAKAKWEAKKKEKEAAGTAMGSGQ
jgi:transforming growth factor-beta-induced protein